MSKCFLAVLFGLSLGLSAHALTDRVWVGPTTDDKWSTNANWNPAGKPIAGDRVIFNGAATSTADLGAVAIIKISMLSTGAGIIINGNVTLNASPENVNIDLLTNSTVNATINASINYTNATLTIRNSPSTPKLFIKGVLSSATNFGVRIYGPGNVEFSSNSSNTYIGPTTVSNADAIGGAAGNLILTPVINGANLVPGDLSILSGATATMSFSGCIADSSTVNIDSGGLFDLNSTSEIIGKLTGTGTVSLGNISSPLVILTVGDGIDFTFAGSITGKGTVIKSGSGAMTITGNNSFAGPTKVLGGTLNLQSPAGSTAVPGDLTLVDAGSNSAVKWLASNQVADTATVTVGSLTSIDLNGFNETIGSLSETGSTVNLVGGELNVTGTLSMINGGSITGLAGLAKLTLGGDVNVSFTSQSAARIDCPVLLNATRTFTVPALGASSLTLGGVISGVGGLTKAGAGRLVIAGSGSQFTGTTTVLAGMLELNCSTTAAIPNALIIGNDSDPADTAVVRNLATADITGDVTVNKSGQLDCNNFGQNIGALNGAGKVLIGTSTFFLGFGDKAGSFSGVISGTGTVNKAGTGTQIFSGNSTYLGVTFVNAGELSIVGQLAGSFQVAAGAKLSGTGKVGSLFNSGTLAPSGAPFSTGSVTMAATSKLDINLNSTTPGAFSSLNVAGVLNINAGATLNFSAVAGVSAPRGSKFVLINNDGSDTITGAFANAPEQASLTAGSEQLTISYVGGTGNDIELTVENTPPAISTPESAVPNPALTGQTVTFSVAATDADLDALTFSWNFGDNTTGTGASTTHAYASAGSFNATVTIFDGQGGSNSSVVTVTVNAPPNSAPVVSTAASAAPSPAFVNQSVTFTVAATDADLDTLTFAWSFGDSTTGTGASTTHAYATAGTFNATVTITDGKGGSASSAVSVIVNVNAAPAVSTAASAAPSPASVNQTVTFTVAATDADSDPLTFAWAFGDSTTGTGASTTHAYATAGTFNATVTITDGKGGSASSAVSVTVTVNAAPVVSTAASAAPSPAAVGQAVAFTVAATDADADPLTFAWSFGDNTTGTGASTTHAYKATGTFNATVTITDGKGGSASSAVSVTVVIPPNSAPVVSTAASAAPSPAVVGQTVTFTVAATDADLDPLTFAWAFGDNSSGSGASATHAYATAGTFNAKVTITDGKGGTVSSAVSVTVSIPPNSPPVLTSPAIATPSTAGTGQAVAFTIAATDANLDPLTFAWDFGDGATGSGASTTHAYAAAGTFNATVKVTDGKGGTAGSAIAVTVKDPQVGEGIDSDGDGFSDTFENAAASDPLSASSTPSGATLLIQPLVVSKLGITLNFAKPSSDSITLSGTVMVSAGFAPNGSIVTFDVGGVAQQFKLSAKGKGVSGKNTCSFGVKAGTQKYSMKLTKGSFAAALADEGLINKSDKGSPHSVKCSMSFNGGIFQTAKAVTYKATEKKSGSVK